MDELAHRAMSGDLGGRDAADILSRMAQLSASLRGDPSLTPSQRRAAELIDNILGRLNLTGIPTTEEPEDEIDMQPLGRADIEQWPREYREERTEAAVTKTPGSSNVYSFLWLEDEPIVGYGQSAPPARRVSGEDNGTLIVTFKDWEPGSNERHNTPGATYAYSNVPMMKYQTFLAATSPDSAGVAVWDYLRVRGTIAGHQHPYRLLSVTGDYIPRKATAKGFATRMLPGGADSSDAWRRSTMEPGPLTRFGQEVGTETPRSHRYWRQNARRNGEPNRGTPNNGRR